MNVSSTHPVSDQSPIEEIANTLTHGLGLVLSLVGLGGLVSLSLRFGDTALVWACGVYGLSLVLLYGASTFYHAARCPKRKHLLKLVDHACIFLLIAGTYTPFAVGPLKGALGWSLLTIVWLVTLVGIPLKTVYIHKTGWLPVLPYLAMGWLGVVAAIPLVQNLSIHGFGWVLAGGLCYSSGTLFYVLDRLPFNHSIWHLFVLAGSACHYIAVARYVIPVA